MANDKPKLPEVRKPLHEAQDAVYMLRHTLAVMVTDDVELRKLMHNVQDSLNKFETELTKKYIWD